MPYLPSIVIAAAGLLLLLVLVVRLVVVLRRFTAVRSLVTAHVAGNVGLVKARSAAVRVAIAERGATRSARSEQPLVPGTIGEQGR
ncbi:MAG: bacteriophage holin [Sciscionella sp.]